jgi:hypothetical protein
VPSSPENLLEFYFNAGAWRLWLKDQPDVHQRLALFCTIVDRLDDRDYWSLLGWLLGRHGERLTPDGA